ncbi:hypothetical protein LOK49_LG02G01442 [Camellia lanceoleosa]|uniref:Uncharacterized protein n=1 Tax=Camellia lanceoleosa TaxID=1840588 RepID=A0ACC0INA4_9ERIC|nr:hypothetical protein LOK49_LG02G01442 [Camellia lanceoleosa]
MQYFRGPTSYNDQPHSLKYETENFDLARLYDQVGVPTGSPYMVNVDDFGAKGDGTDDSEDLKDSVLVVPEDRIYHLKPINFSGPRSSHISIKLLFQNLRNFEAEGGGTINGNGKIWWKKSCKIDKSRPCTDAPTKCVNVKVQNLIIVAPGNSPNSDGIHVTGTQNIQIIKTGDDCISIASGSKNIKVTDITCGPGHGISIGSLGQGNSEARVLDASVNRVKFSGSTNGGGSEYVKNIKFQDALIHNPSAMQVENVWYKNIKGTSASKLAIQLNCSQSLPCKGIVLQDIILAAA